MIYDPERVRAWLGSFTRENMGLILSILAVYAVICAAAYFGNRQFMYFPDPGRVVPGETGLDGVEELEISATDGTILVAWQAPAKEVARMVQGHERHHEATQNIDGGNAFRRRNRQIFKP